MDIILQLVLKTEDEQEQEVPLSGKRVTIGRAAQNTVQLHDTIVSARHAVITESENGDLHIEDRSSRNGTFVNGKRVTRKTDIKPGDIIKIAKFEFFIETKPEDGIPVIPLKNRRKKEIRITTP